MLQTCSTDKGNKSLPKNRYIYANKNKNSSEKAKTV